MRKIVIGFMIVFSALSARAEIRRAEMKVFGMD